MKRQIDLCVLMSVLGCLMTVLACCRNYRCNRISNDIVSAERRVAGAHDLREKSFAIRNYVAMVCTPGTSVNTNDILRVLGIPDSVADTPFDCELWTYLVPIDRTRILTCGITIDRCGRVEGNAVDGRFVMIDQDDYKKAYPDFDWRNEKDYMELCGCLWHDAFTLTNETAESLVSVVSAHFAVGFDREGARRIQFQSKNFKSDRNYSAAITGGALESQVDELSEKLNVLCTERWTNTGGNMTKVYTFDFSQPYDGPGGYQ